MTLRTDVPEPSMYVTEPPKGSSFPWIRPGASRNVACSQRLDGDAASNACRCPPGRQAIAVTSAVGWAVVDAVPLGERPVHEARAIRDPNTIAPRRPP